MTSLVILPVTICEVEIGERWRAIVLVRTEVWRRRISESREVKGALAMARLLKLVHNDSVELWRVGICMAGVKMRKCARFAMTC